MRFLYPALRPSLVLVFVFTLLVPLVARGDAEGSPGDNCNGGVRVDVTVVPDQEPLDVDPASLTIYREPGPGQAGRVCWVVGGLQQGETLHIAGKPDSPVEAPFPNLERTITAPRDRANSGAPAKTGTWTYNLWITREGSDERFHFTDPEVIIHSGGPGTDEGDGGG